LVFHDHNCSHWTPWESCYCCWLPFNMVMYPFQCLP
jgi:hypothetical protein